MSDEAIERKFRANADPVIGSDNARKAAELVWRLESMSDVRELTAVLA